MGSIIGHRIDYNGGRSSESPTAHTKINPSIPPPPRSTRSTCRKAGLNKSNDTGQDTNEEILGDEAQDETDEAVESDLV